MLRPPRVYPAHLLTHELIGGLVGSRRPTVSLALHKLSAPGRSKDTTENRWMLARGILSA